jgi:hypothetical protein
MLEQHAPARFSLGWYAAASAFVQIGTASRAESFAILPALDVGRSREQPRLSYGSAEIQHPRIWIVQKHIRIVRFIGADAGEEEVYLLIYGDVDFFETQPARKHDPAVDTTGEIESSFARRRQPSDHSNRPRRTDIAFFPNGIVRLNRAVHVDGFGLQRAYVKGQHKPLTLAGLRTLFQCDGHLFLRQSFLTEDYLPGAVGGPAEGFALYYRTDLARLNQLSFREEEF